MAVNHFHHYPMPTVGAFRVAQPKWVLYNYGGSGEVRRNSETWTRAPAAGIDGLLTDYPLECRIVWRDAKE